MTTMRRIKGVRLAPLAQGQIGAFLLFYFGLSTFLLTTLAEAAEPTTVVSIQSERDVRASISVKGNAVSVVINDPQGVTEISFVEETEKQIRINVDDYNFDGKQEFSFWHIDDGKGAYSIHRIFLYTTKTKSFVEIYPRCGDQFLNLKVNRKKRVLISTYYENNIPKLCVTRPRLLKK